MRRAAGLATLPQDVGLELYTARRPRRSTDGDLESWATRLEESGASATAAFVREAAEVYAARGLLA
jgi:propanediol dehydratase small subunit